MSDNKYFNKDGSPTKLADEEYDKAFKQEFSPLEADISLRTGKPKSRKGFAAMDPERQREIAKKGGASVPDYKRSFYKDHDLAAKAGQKGGFVFGKNRKKGEE